MQHHSTGSGAGNFVLVGTSPIFMPRENVDFLPLDQLYASQQLSSYHANLVSGVSNTAGQSVMRMGAVSGSNSEASASMVVASPGSIALVGIALLVAFGRGRRRQRQGY